MDVRCEPVQPGLPDLAWVDDWAANVRDHVFVRAVDRVFIQRPNRAVHLNERGVAVLEPLLRGVPIAEVLAPWGRRADVWCDVERFLLDVRKLLQDGLADTYESPAVDKQPFAASFSPLPVMAEVAVTYRCNARCEFCYAGCNCTCNPVGSDVEMTLDDVRRVLDAIRNDAQVPSVSFTGGEATLRRDLAEMVQYARSIGLRVNLITNGILSDERRVTELVEAGLQSVQVSIEGVTDATHDRITGIPGSFEKATAAVRRYLAAGLNVNTNTTLDRHNVGEAARFPGFARRELGLRTISMNLMIPTGTAARDDALVVRYAEVGPVIDAVQRAARAEGVEFKWYSPTPMCIFNPITHGLGNKGCSACDGLLSIGADGSVLPCASYDEPLGSLLRDGFDAVWQSPRARAFRAKARAPVTCRGCDNFDICNGACPLYWRQLGCEELRAVRQGGGDDR
ncbi:MAG: radical SAM protein [Planctomycetes bacterium]|nr:radical SAM protein [Planctomycetota bacterium]